ncbi:hypothetical protein EAO28_29530 [Klebsiella pneumoniae]|uniref:Uncharacterized protein n=1 Tax=Klebsiella pneumoniae TaxID=573 RepID=A0A3P2EKC8_KLEPN|nr:hypothetical protein EAO28_29530 [Klebsiella pneumoniae]
MISSISCCSFSLLFHYVGLLPVFPVWLADVNHLTKTNRDRFLVYLVIRHYFSAGVRPDVG